MTAVIVAEEIAVGVRRAAALLDLSDKTVRQLLRDGELRGYRTLGGHHRVLVAELRRWAEAQTEAAQS